MPPWLRRSSPSRRPRSRKPTCRKDKPDRNRRSRSGGDARTSRKSRRKTIRRSPRCRRRRRPSSVAAEATATPSSESIPEGPRSVAPAIGTGESARRVRATWQKELVAHLDKHKRYPAERAAEVRRDPGSLHARPAGPRAVDRDREGLGRYRLRRGRAGDGASAPIRCRVPPPLIADEGLSFTLAGDLPRQGQELKGPVGGLAQPNPPPRQAGGRSRSKSNVRSSHRNCTQPGEACSSGKSVSVLGVQSLSRSSKIQRKTSRTETNFASRFNVIWVVQIASEK